MIKKFKKNISSKAFTLIEIISVIVIIALLVLVMIPAIREFVSAGKYTTYNSYIKNMRNAAVSYMTECIRNNDLNCDLPKTGESKVIYLDDLVKMGFSERLRDPEATGYCDEDVSYVTIINNGKNTDDVDYEACLYCSNYQTNSPTCIKYTGEGSSPVCGMVTGGSTTWSNKNRTISVKCERGGQEPGSECLKDVFSKTFIASTDKGIIRISTASGKSTDCEVDVKVDRDKPTCTLRVKKGNLMASGWYGGETIVELNTQNDVGGSGILTYGMGTSLNTRDYNKNTEVNIGDGITTVFGYVMDKAGNEGYCNLEIKADTTRPVISKGLKGYQVYPDKETYVLGGLTVNGNTHTTTNTDPRIELSNLNNYKQVSRVVVRFEAPLSEGMITQVFYKTTGNSYNEANSVRRTVSSGASSIFFDIPENTYEGIRVDLGDRANLTYRINRIELVVGDTTDLYTNKDVMLYVVGTDNMAGISKYSYDDGLTWVTQSNKLYTANQNITIKIMDNAGNESESLITKVENIDKLPPSCTLKAVGTLNNGWYSGNVMVGFDTTLDAPATSQYAMSNINRSGIGSISGGISVDVTTDTSSAGISYTGYVDDKAGNTYSCVINVKRDSTAPTVTFNPNGNTTPKTNQTVVVTHSDGSGSGVTSSQYAWSTSNTVQPTFSSTYTSGQTLSKTSSTSANYYLWVKTVDAAGNTRITVSNAFNVVPPSYTITYNLNGGTGTINNQMCYLDLNCIITSTIPIRTNYRFLGWSIVSTATTAAYTSGQPAINLTTPENTITLYAVWSSLAYKVNYNMNGGTGTIGQQICYENSNCVISSTVPTRTNYRFLGWSKNSSATTQTYNSGQSVSGLSTANNDVTLYAVWTYDSYQVVFNPNGGSGTTASKSCTYGKACTLTTNGFTKAGNTFGGWAKTSGGAVAYANGATVTNLATSGTVTLYAVWYPVPGSGIATGTTTATWTSTQTKTKANNGGIAAKTQAAVTISGITNANQIVYWVQADVCTSGDGTTVTATSVTVNPTLEGNNVYVCWYSRNSTNQARSSVASYGPLWIDGTPPTTTHSFSTSSSTCSLRVKGKSTDAVSGISKYYRCQRGSSHTSGTNYCEDHNSEFDGTQNFGSSSTSSYPQVFFLVIDKAKNVTPWVHAGKCKNG